MSRYTRHPRRDRQRARILAAIASGPLTAQELADRLHLSRDGINLHIAQMRKETPRALHISGHVFNRKGGRPAPQYSLGDLPDATYTASRAPTRHEQRDKQRARAKAELKAQPMTARQLGARMGICSGWARHYIGELREEKQAYIKGWATLNAGTAPIYAIGQREDEPKPPQDGKSVYARRKALRKVDDHAQEQYERDLARRRLNGRIEKFKRVPQTPFSALFAGRPA